MSGGGKGGPTQPVTKEFSYSVSLAIALCGGEITRVGRIWVDGDEISPNDLNMRVYVGSADQQPDSLMEATEGVGQVPAYRGTAYVVLEYIQLQNLAIACRSSRSRSCALNSPMRLVRRMR